MIYLFGSACGGEVFSASKHLSFNEALKIGPCFQQPQATPRAFEVNKTKRSVAYTPMKEYVWKLTLAKGS